MGRARNRGIRMSEHSNFHGGRLDSSFPSPICISDGRIFGRQHYSQFYIHGMDIKCNVKNEEISNGAVKSIRLDASADEFTKIVVEYYVKPFNGETKEKTFLVTGFDVEFGEEVIV